MMKNSKRSCFVELGLKKPFLLVLGLWLQSAVALDEVVGANAVLNVPLDGRSHALGGALMALPGQGLSFVSQPSNWVQDTLSRLWLHHGTLYGEGAGDQVGLSLNMKNHGSLAAQISRWGYDGIPRIDSGEVVVGSDYRTFDIADYALQIGFARQWRFVNYGTVLHLLYRDLDQTGLGMRLDAGASSQWRDWTLALRLDALTSSAARWQSEVLEYQNPDMLLALAWNRKTPYLYGTLSAHWQSAPWFQQGPKGVMIFDDSKDGEGEVFTGRMSDDPWRWLQVSSFGMEYSGTHGLSLRLALQNVGSVATWTSGLGFEYKQWSLLYSAAEHPDLGLTQRFGISWAWNAISKPDYVPGGSPKYPKEQALP
jgi:hypothetical protein